MNIRKLTKLQKVTIVAIIAYMVLEYYVQQWARTRQEAARLFE